MLLHAWVALSVAELRKAGSQKSQPRWFRRVFHLLDHHFAPLVNGSAGAISHLRCALDNRDVSHHGYVYFMYKPSDGYIGKTAATRADGNSGLVARFREHVMACRRPSKDNSWRYKRLRAHGILEMRFLPVAAAASGPILASMEAVVIKQTRPSLNGGESAGLFEKPQPVSCKQYRSRPLPHMRDKCLNSVWIVPSVKKKGSW